MSLLQLQNVSKSFGETAIIRDVSLSIAQGEKHAIIGPNGAGKSTLFNLISGRYGVSSGNILFKGNPIHNLKPFEIARMGLARSFQVTNIFPLLSVFENIRCGLLWSMDYRYSFWNLVSRQKALNARTEAVLEEIGLHDRRNFPAGELAYAEQRALELGIAIASGAEMILLDEPVAGMSHSEAKNAVALIRKVTEGKTLVMVEHDMSIVFDVADRITVLVYGEVIASDVPAKIRGNPRVQEAYLGEVVTGDGVEATHA
ncbi:MAG: ABC transporter ATP-binding protein [Gammaproteobacteria bacterium]|nr:ABC transporter ATP-binding protein [Gammaproteobacteria bacterium]MDP2141748.1 ABC transporter ATP-binding protein [Gammaproteobacteria bacterium]MDP2347980.1 ABC transporter ATP-binding protein [Gammaproteobacteria bacterium]